MKAYVLLNPWFISRSDSRFRSNFNSHLFKIELYTGTNDVYMIHNNSR